MSWKPRSIVCGPTWRPGRRPRAEVAATAILRTVRFQAIFFDVGETLVHPAPSFAELFASILTGQGHPCEPEAVTAASRVVMHRFSEAARDNELWTTSPERSRSFWTEIYDRMLGQLGLPAGDGLREQLYKEFTELSNYVLFDDVPAVLASLASSGATLGIVSNFEAWLEDLLDSLGVRDAFPVRVISGIEGMEKPDPRIYELALTRAGVEPAGAAFVGDNPEFDVEPPKAMGMFTVLIDRRGRHPDHGGARISDLGDLPALLEVS
jgi:putative hydrolase of the HAD superfamily